MNLFREHHDDDDSIDGDDGDDNDDYRDNCNEDYVDDEIKVGPVSTFDLISESSHPAHTLRGCYLLGS